MAGSPGGKNVVEASVAVVVEPVVADKLMVPEYPPNAGKACAAGAAPTGMLAPALGTAEGEGVGDGVGTGEADDVAADVAGPTGVSSTFCPPAPLEHDTRIAVPKTSVRTALSVGLMRKPL